MHKLPDDRPCTQCGKAAPEVAFSYHAVRGRSPSCRECKRIKSKEWSEKNREKKNAGSRDYYKRNKAAHQMRVVGWQKGNSEKIRLLSKGYKYKKNYKLTLNQLHQMWLAQNGLCGICGLNISDPSHENVQNVMAVDHDHITGSVRGMLCSSCNLALGGFKDDPKLLAAALQWVLQDRQTLTQVVEDI